MPFASQWYVPGAVIYSRFWGKTTGEEIIGHSELLNTMMDETEREHIHVLVDVATVTMPPPLTTTIRAARAVPSHQHSGWILTVGEHDMLLKFISNASRQLLQLRTGSFNTLEEALDFLKEMDDTIDWSQARAEVLSSSAS